MHEIVKLVFRMKVKVNYFKGSEASFLKTSIDIKE